MYSEAYLDPIYLSSPPYHKPRSSRRRSDHVVDEFVIPLDVMYCLIDKVPGPAYTSEHMQRIFYELESFTQFANRTGYTIPRPDDRELDIQIINALNSYHDKEVPSLDCVKRVEQHWDCIQRMDLPESLKMATRDEFSRLTYGGVNVIRKSASLYR